MAENLERNSHRMQTIKAAGHLGEKQRAVLKSYDSSMKSWSKLEPDLCALFKRKSRIDSRQEEYLEAMVHWGHTEEGSAHCCGCRRAI